jgi:hypothetical protein
MMETWTLPDADDMHDNSFGGNEMIGARNRREREVRVVLVVEGCDVCVCGEFVL